ncbi:MAG: PspC domain-containing protein [Candidatus Thermoplasmatota archaeon]
MYKNQSENKSEKTGKYFHYKRLYRSGNDKVLGGVCGGLGEYLKIDPVIIRLVFIFALFISLGGAILLYLIM